MMNKYDITKKNVLIVEDSQVVVLELRERLKSIGYKIAGSAATGEKAIELTREKNPDLILMDIKLEGNMTGINAARAIQKFTDVPVIYTTAYSDNETLKDLNKTSPYAYLKKPYDDRELSTAITIALDRYENAKKLKVSEQKYRSLFDNSKDAIYIIDRNGRFMHINRSFTDLFGINPENILEKSISDIFHNRDDMLNIQLDIDEYGFSQDQIFKMIARDKKIIQCQMTSSKLFNEKNEHTGYQGIIRDVTYISNFIKSQHDMIHNIVEALVLILEVRDPYTAGHQRRVATISKMIAKELNFSEAGIEKLEMAAMIHDLGKIRVPSEILTKPSVLDPYEYKLIQMHPQVGSDIIKGIDFNFPLADIILQHHERCNGSGYPQGLKKDEIIMEARIIAIADVVEAMGSHRPYRASLGPEKALEEIKANRGELYDPDAAGAFFTVFHSTDILKTILEQ